MLCLVNVMYTTGFPFCLKWHKKHVFRLVSTRLRVKHTLLSPHAPLFSIPELYRSPSSICTRSSLPSYRCRELPCLPWARLALRHVLLQSGTSSSTVPAHKLHITSIKLVLSYNAMELLFMYNIIFTPVYFVALVI